MRRSTQIVVLAVLVAACRQSPMQRLITASRGVRFAEARLCGFAYAPPRPAHRGAEDAPDVSTLRLAASAADVLASAASNDPETRRARAAALLIAKHPDKAVKELESLVAVDRNDARAWSDLAAARYELARKDDDAQSFASALGAAANAVSFDPAFPPAQFNRALALEALQLRAPAMDSWRRYLATDGASGWAIDARERLKRSNRPTQRDAWSRASARLELAGLTTPANDVAGLIRTYPQQARTWAEGEYLYRWATARMRGDSSGAKRWLVTVRTIGKALRRQSGESQLLDAVAAIDRADSGRLIPLSSAQVKYHEGRIRYRDRDIEQAVRLFAEAEKEFRAGSSPLAVTARFYRANAMADRGEEDAALLMLADVTSELHSDYRALAAYIEWERANILARIGRPLEALDEIERARNSFQELGEFDNEVRMANEAATLLSFLGRSPDAWRMRREIFRAASDSGDDVVLEHALHACARNELQDGRADVARALLDIELARPPTSPRLRVDALLARMTADARPVRNFDLVRRAALTIPSNALRDEALDDIRLAESAAVRDQDPRLSIQLASAAIDFRTQRHLPLTLPAACLQRARAYRKLNELDAAVADLTRAVNAVEQQRAAISRTDLRDTYAGLAGEAYSELIDVQVRLGRYSEAFTIAEQARTRGSRDVWSAPPTTQHLLDAPAIAEALPPRTLIADYIATTDRLLIMTVSATGVKSYTTKPIATTQASDEYLFDMLVAPFSRELASVDTLVIVPATCLESIPFAALRNRVSGRYLMEDVAVVIAPAANTYLHAACLSHVAEPQRVLLVADPEFDGRRFPALPRLGNARNVVAELSRIYPRAVHLVGAAATRSRVVKEIESSDVIDIAAHAVVNQRDAWLSVVPLVPSTGDSGLLYLHDIAANRTTRGAIVILVGCQTAVATGGSGTVRSLAMAFLAAGSRSVVGTLSDVDDSIAAEFSRALHAALSRGLTPARAVRAVQISMLHSENPALRVPGAWGAFEIYGSDR